MLLSASLKILLILLQGAFVKIRTYRSQVENGVSDPAYIDGA